MHPRYHGPGARGAETCHRPTSCARTGRESRPAGASPRASGAPRFPTERRTGRDCTFKDTLRVVDEQLDPCARRTDLVGAALGGVARVDLVKEERSASHLEPRHTAEVPELGRAERVLVPGDGYVRGRDDQHHRHRRRLLPSFRHRRSFRRSFLRAAASLPRARRRGRRSRTPMHGCPAYDGAVASEAELSRTDAGLVPASAGWFVLNARDGRCSGGRAAATAFRSAGCDEYEAETFFPMLGMSLQVLSPGEPNGTYHWETEQEDFLALSGQALLIVEGRERRLKQWDFVHCPPETRHVFVGAGATVLRDPRGVVSTLPEGWTLGFLCGRRDGRSVQRIVTRGDAGWEHRVRPFPPEQEYALPRWIASWRLGPARLRGNATLGRCVRFEWDATSPGRHQRSCVRGALNDGWTASAAAWVAALGEEGDFTRRYVTDAAMVARIEGRAFRTALDVGCGEGRFCRILRRRGIAATGVDPTQASRRSDTARSKVIPHRPRRSSRLPRRRLRSGCELPHADRHPRPRGGCLRDGASPRIGRNAADRQPRELQYRRHGHRMGRGSRRNPPSLHAGPVSRGACSRGGVGRHPDRQLAPAAESLPRAAPGAGPAAGPFRRAPSIRSQPSRDRRLRARAMGLCHGVAKD